MVLQKPKGAKKIVYLINVYDKQGEVVDKLEFTERLTYLSGRVSKSESGLYYKGVGVPYSRQLCAEPNGHRVLGKAEVFYCGYECQNENYLGKFGIFQETYQPYFSDFIGSCGPKELSIIRNSREFERSAVEVFDCINYDETNRQFYFEMNYVTRKGYIWDDQPEQLYALMQYMVAEGWNFPWDKASIKDIVVGGLVSDVADMFRSKDLIHQIGTVYSVVYSLSKLSKKAFVSFCDYLHINIINDRQIPNLVVLLLEQFGVDTDPLFNGIAEDNHDWYYHFVGDALIRGRNCAYVEDWDYGAKVRDEYVDKFRQVVEGR